MSNGARQLCSWRTTWQENWSNEVQLITNDQSFHCKWHCSLYLRYINCDLKETMKTVELFDWAINSSAWLLPFTNKLLLTHWLKDLINNNSTFWQLAQMQCWRSGLSTSQLLQLAMTSWCLRLPPPAYKRTLILWTIYELISSLNIKRTLITYCGMIVVNSAWNLCASDWKQKVCKPIMLETIYIWEAAKWLPPLPSAIRLNAITWKTSNALKVLTDES